MALSFFKKKYWMFLERKKLFNKKIYSHITNHQFVHKVGGWYCQEVCKKEYESQFVCKINERPIEYKFVFQSLIETSPTSVLDVGTGTTALPHLISTTGSIVTAMDNIYDYWPKGIFNRHFFVKNIDITKANIYEKFEFITCVSVLEHIANYNTAVKSMFDLLTPGGYLLLTFPYNEKVYIDNVYKLPESSYGQDAPYICQVFSRKELAHWIEMNKGRILEQEYWQTFTGDFWTFGERIYPPRQVDMNEKHHLTCVLMQKNG